MMLEKKFEETARWPVKSGLNEDDIKRLQSKVDHVEVLLDRVETILKDRHNQRKAGEKRVLEWLNNIDRKIDNLEQGMIKK